MEKIYRGKSHKLLLSIKFTTHSLISKSLGSFRNFIIFLKEGA
jgi:hypothetical protein